MAISLLNAHEIINISNDFKWKYHLNEEEDEIRKILIEKGNKKFYIFRYIAIIKNFLILSKNLKFTIEVPINAERLYIEELNKACYIKIISRRKKENEMYNNEIYATIDVYY